MMRAFTCSIAALLGYCTAFGLAGEPNANNPKSPAAPKEFAFTLSAGYGTVDHLPSDPKIFENLLVNMKKAGFNTLHCVYRDWRLELCRKHGVKMMVDVLAWKEDTRSDIRKPDQRKRLMKICKKLRGDSAVWGYNLWNEKLSFFGYPDRKSIDDYIALLKKWDNTHPIWVGTYRVHYANGPKQKPGVHAYYDYHWQRGFNWHFADLQWYQKYVPSQDGFIGRWILGSDYRRNSYTLNTSIPFGLKACIWFIGGPFDKKGNIDPKHRFHHLVKIGREMHLLYPELGKTGRPTAVYSTPTTKWHDNKDRKRDVPWRLTPFPKDFWFQIVKGEALAGFFTYSAKEDAVFIANHNAFAAQTMVVQLPQNVRDKDTAVQLFNRKTGKWQPLELKDGRFTFPIRPAGGELIRIVGREK